MIGDVLRGTDLDFWAQAGLVLFLAGYALVVIRTFLIRPGDALEAAMLPLEDDTGEVADP